MAYYDNKPSYGGFFPDNIRKALIEECIDSGNPVSYLWCLKNVIDDMVDDTGWMDETPEDAE